MFSYERKVFFNCDVINEKGSRSRYAGIIARALAKKTLLTCNKTPEKHKKKNCLNAEVHATHKYN